MRQNFISPFEDDRAQDAIAQAIAGDDTDAKLKSALIDQAALSKLAGLPAATPTSDLDAGGRSSSEPRARPLDRGMDVGKSAIGNVDPSLAFFAAFSQNPVLQKMVEDAKNRPRIEAEASRQTAQDQRAQERWQQERDLLAPLRAEGKRNENALGASKLEDSRGGTPYAKAIHESALTQTQMLASRLAAAGSPLADQMATVSKLIASNPGMSPKQVQQLLAPFGDLANKVVGDVQKSQALEAQGAGRQQSNARGWASLNEQQRHNRAMEEQGGQKMDMKVQGNQEKLNEKVEGWNNTDDLLAQASEAKKNVDVGPIATPINKIRQYTPWPNKDFNDLQQSLGSVRNEIKLLKSGKAVTPSEEKGLNEELANLEQYQDDATFEQRLQGMRARIGNYKKRAINQYQRKGGGETVDRSNTAREATKSEPSLTPGEQATRMKAPPGKAPGSVVRQKSTGKTFRVTADGMLEEVQ